jgi:hypothetical protein
VVWGTGLVLALTYSLLLYFLLSLGLPGLFSIGLVILALLAGNHYWFSRPGTVNFFFYLAALCLLENYRRAPRRQLWGLPPLFLLWANLHIGFMVGLLAVFLYGLCAALAPREFRGPSAPRDLRLLMIFPLCLAALCVNPYGLSLFPYARGVTSASFVNDHVIEMQSPDFHKPIFVFFFCQLALLLWLGGSSYPGRSLHLTLLTITLGMALYSGRHITFFSLTATLTLAYLLQVRLKGEIPPPVPGPRQGWAWAVLAVLLSLLWVVGVHHWRPGFYDFTARAIPRGAAGYLEQQFAGRPLRVFSMDDQWASYLIYHLYPRVQVFIDTRFEFYGDSFTREYLSLRRQARHNLEVLNPWGVDFLVWKIDELAARPEPRPDWTLAYEDHQALVYRHLAREEATKNSP